MHHPNSLEHRGDCHLLVPAEFFLCPLLGSDSLPLTPPSHSPPSTIVMLSMCEVYKGEKENTEFLLFISMRRQAMRREKGGYAVSGIECQIGGGSQKAL